MNYEADQLCFFVEVALPWDKAIMFNDARPF